MSYVVERCEICGQVIDDGNVAPEDPHLCDVCADTSRN